MIHAAAPHLYCYNPEEADDRVELLRLIHDLPNDTIRSLIGTIGQLTPKDVLEAREEAEAQAEAERQRLIRKALSISRKGRPPGRPPGRKSSTTETPTDE